MSYCSICKIELTDENGYRHKSGKQAGKFCNHCRPCAIERANKWRKENPEKCLESSRLWHRRNPGASKARHQIFSDRIAAFKKGRPCCDCGGVFPTECLDFDHLRDKKFCVGNGGCGRPWESTLAEIEKCEIVCANCHRTRTKNRRLCKKKLSNQ